MFDDIIDFAIEREKEANKFYAELTKKVKGTQIKKILERFGKMELGHKAKLEAMKKGKPALQKSEGAKNRGISLADYLLDVEPSAEMGYRELLVIGMKKERVSQNLYNDLAEQVKGEEAKNLFLMLAKEEAEHKAWFETEYENVVLMED